MSQQKCADESQQDYTDESQQEITEQSQQGDTDQTQTAGRDGTESSNWWNRIRYGLYAPVYDWMAAPFESGRKRAIERVDPQPDDRILILGCGTGMDLEYLPDDAAVTAIDVSKGMIERTERRADRLGMDVDARVDDAQSLPFDDGEFDLVLLHLVISVVPDPSALVEEATRVLAADGCMSIYDKFVAEDSQPSLLRRAANPVARLVFADLNRRLEPLVSTADLDLESTESFLGIYLVTVARHAGDSG